MRVAKRITHSLLLSLSLSHTHTMSSLMNASCCLQLIRHSFITSTSGCDGGGWTDSIREDRTPAVKEKGQQTYRHVVASLQNHSVLQLMYSYQGML